MYKIHDVDLPVTTDGYDRCPLVRGQSVAAIYLPLQPEGLHLAAALRLVLREMAKDSYRKTEALLKDSPEWCQAIGMDKAPDHATLHRAADLLTRAAPLEELIQHMISAAVILTGLPTVIIKNRIARREY